VSEEDSTHESLEKGCKFRHFCIKGDIVVSEQVTFQEKGTAQDLTEGKAAKTTIAIDKLEAGNVLDPKCYDVHTHAPLDLDEVPCGCGDDAPYAIPIFPAVGQCELITTNPLKKCPLGYLCTGSGSSKQCTLINNLNGFNFCIYNPANTDCTYKDETGATVTNGGTCNNKGYCVPKSCCDDDDCNYPGIVFCHKARTDTTPGPAHTCVFRSEFDL
jgi:hypothetical protein